MTEYRSEPFTVHIRARVEHDAELVFTKTLTAGACASLLDRMDQARDMAATSGLDVELIDHSGGFDAHEDDDDFLLVERWKDQILFYGPEEYASYETLVVWGLGLRGVTTKRVRIDCESMRVDARGVTWTFRRRHGDSDYEASLSRDEVESLLLLTSQKERCLLVCVMGDGRTEIRSVLVPAFALDPRHRGDHGVASVWARWVNDALPGVTRAFFLEYTQEVEIKT